MSLGLDILNTVQFGHFRKEEGNFSWNFSWQQFKNGGLGLVARKFLPGDWTKHWEKGIVPYGPYLGFWDLTGDFLGFWATL